MTEEAKLEGGAVEEAVPTQEEVWERTVAAPISKEEVRGKREEEPEVLPDRALVAPELAKALEATKEPTVDPIQERLDRLEELLSRETEAEPLPREERLLQELESLKQQQADMLARQQQEAAEKEYTAKMEVLRDGVVANIRSDREKFPGLVALGQEEFVFNTLVQKLQAGEQVSEDDIASEAEAQFRSVYEKLAGVYGSTAPSEEPKPSEAKPSTTTLHPSLTAEDAPFDLESAIRQDKRKAAAELWDRLQKR